MLYETKKMLIPLIPLVIFAAISLVFSQPTGLESDVAKDVAVYKTEIAENSNQQIAIFQIILEFAKDTVAPMTSNGIEEITKEFHDV